jgi:hypothetical protein
LYSGYDYQCNIKDLQLVVEGFFVHILEWTILIIATIL